jgi:hypothetical protein
MSTVLEGLDSHRSQVQTRSGSASYIDTGGPDRSAPFVHGVGTSSYLWRHVIDLPLHGQTPAVVARTSRCQAWPASSRTSATRSD